MDISATLCLMYDTLKQDAPVITENIWFVSDNQIVLTPAIVTSTTKTPKSSDFTIKDTPFLILSRDIFSNDNAIILADIDAVNHMTTEIFMFDKKTSNQSFSYCTTIKDFSVYLDYRYPKSAKYLVDMETSGAQGSQGYTLTATKINLKNVNIGQITAVILQQTKGVDLVICDIDTVLLG